MPDYRTPNTQGSPPNPIEKGLSQDAVRTTRAKPVKTPNPFLASMENAGITGTSGAAMTSSNPVGKKVPEEPEQIMTPDVVSATDPAYSMHPILKALMQGGGQPTAGTTPMSPWQMLGPEFLAKALTKPQLASASGMPGLDWGIQSQGQAL